VGTARDGAALPAATPASAGQAPQQPGLPPLAVSQIEEGRRSEAMNQPFSLSFAEPISIRELLLLLVRDTSLSVVLDPDVEGTFSGELKNVTLRQALGLVLEPHGFVATFYDNVVRVRREQVQTRLFNINYVATRRSGTRGTGLTGTYGQGAYGYGMTGGVTAAGYGGGYKYPHDFEGNYVVEEYLPDPLRGERIVKLSENGLEKALGERWKALREKLGK